jgi:predicted hotdog family 3-hydroxylacyl-ACP dehydratase
MTPSSEPLPPVAQLIPHAAPMRLIDRVLTCDAVSVRVETTLRSDGPFVTNGSVSALVALELMAQTAAAWMGCNRPPGAAPAPGYLVNVRDMVLGCATLATGQPVVTALQLEGEDGELAVFRGTLTSSGMDAPLATATFSVYREAS